MLDVRKIRTLGKLLLRLETRSKSGSNRKLIVLNISYLLPGIFLPWLLLKQNTDPSGFEFTFVTYLFFSLILAFTIISELDNIIISKSETELLSALPIDDALLVRAKMYMLTRYIIFLSLPLLIPGSVYFFILIKSYSRAVMYFASGLMLMYFIVNIIIFVYCTALKIFKSAKLSTYTLIFQLAMVLFMIVGYQFLSFGISGKQGNSASGYIHLLQAKGIIDFFPHSWFSLLPAKHNYVPDLALISKLILPVTICYLSYFTLKLNLTENYSHIREKFQNVRFFNHTEAKSENKFFLTKAFNDFIQNIYLRNHLERSSFGLMKSLFRSEKTVRLAIIPMIIIPAGLALFAMLTDQLPPPFSRNYFELKPVFHISILLCVFVVLNTAILSVRVTNYTGVSWIYNAYPVDSLKHFKNGFRKFFIVYLLAPVCLILGIIFLFKIPADQAFINLVFIFATANLYNTIFNLLSKVLPFTKENTLVNSLQRMTSILFPFLYGIVIAVFQLLIYRNFLSAIIGTLSVITLTFWLNYFGFVRDKKSS